MKTPGRRLVLVLEDSTECAETLQIALEGLPGIEVHVCAHARDLWLQLDRHHGRIAAVVTDLHLNSALAQGDGFEVIRRLRADERFALTPILLISGDSDPRLPELALRHGASAWFGKPWSPAAVRRKLEALLCREY